MQHLINILICDDHPIIRDGLKNLILKHPEMQMMFSASNIRELIDKLNRYPVDVLILDINLPDGNGMEVCARIKKKYPHIKILGFSNFNDKSIVLNMLSNGASGYLLKSASINQIEDAILRVYNNEFYIDKDLMLTLAEITEDASAVAIPPITKREKEVLEYLEKGYSSQEIAQQLFLSPLTVDTHRKNLLQKFKVNKTISLLQKAKELGMISKD